MEISSLPFSFPAARRLGKIDLIKIKKIEELDEHAIYV